MNIFTFQWKPERGLYCLICHFEYKEKATQKVFDKAECPFCGSKLLRWCSDFISYDY